MVWFFLKRTDYYCLKKHDPNVSLIYFSELRKKELLYYYYFKLKNKVVLDFVILRGKAKCFSKVAAFSEKAWCFPIVNNLCEKTNAFLRHVTVVNINFCKSTITKLTWFSDPLIPNQVDWRSGIALSSEKRNIKKRKSHWI